VQIPLNNGGGRFTVPDEQARSSDQKTFSQLSQKPPEQAVKRLASY